MPDLSDLMKSSVDEIPPFDPAAMVARGRRHRNLQLVSATSIVVVIAIVLTAWNHASSNGVFVATRSSTESTESTNTTDTTDSSSTMVTSASTGSPSTAPIGTTTTGYPHPPPPTVEPSTTLPDVRAPQAGDFTGTLTASPTTVHLPYGVSVDLWIRNASAYAVEPSLGTMTTSVATICGKFTADGRPEAALVSDVNLWFMTAPRLQPGETAGRSNLYDPSADGVGTVLCEGAIVRSTDGWQTIEFVARITAIPAVTITVLPESTTSTAP